MKRRGTSTLGYVLRRLAALPLVLFCVATLSFFLMRFAPGGPFDAERSLPPAVERNIRAKFHLDEPLWQQYLRYLGAVCRGDLGPSFKYRDRTVNDLIGEAFPVSLALGLFAMSIATSAGVALGVAAAVRKNTAVDYGAMAAAMVGISVPSFVLAMALLMVFGFWLRVLPVAGWGSPWHAILPGLTLAAGPTAYVARLMRASMLEELGRDYIRTARAKGLSEAAVVLRHGLRNSILPVVSFLGPCAAAVLTGSVVVEKIFAVPGLGTHFVNGALNRDYTLVMGLILLYSGLLVVFNLAADLALAWLDPRIRLT